MIIRFWNAKDTYGIFSNFAETPLVIDGTRYPTAEHFFQAQKTKDSQEWSDIVRAPTPLDAKRLGRKVHLRDDWEVNKCSVMLWALREKATQCPEFRQALIDSGDAELQENSPFDFFWGTRRDGAGRNMLGELLMDVRQMIKDGVL